MKKRDLLFVAIAVTIVLVLWAAPPESRLKVPFDDTHRELKATLEREGKKAAEKSCQTCHNEKDLPLSKDHPPKYRCLFCHKFAEAGQKTETVDSTKK
jgi:cytochrome c5